jgi:hypothetical protein
MCLICVKYKLNSFKHVKYTLNIVQNTLMYIKCIRTPQKKTKLQLNLWLNEHKGLFLDEKPKDVQFSDHTIYMVAKIVRKLEGW